MSYRWGMVPLFVVLMGAGPRCCDDEKKEVRRLQGAWKVVRAESKGEQVPMEDLLQLAIIFVDDAIQVKEGDKINEKFVYALDLKHKPRRIDFTFTDGPKKGRTDRAIYKLDGDDLQICIQEDRNAPRPTDFVTKQGTSLSMVVLKRAR